MINLLSPQAKSEIRAARLNVKLLKLTILGVCAAAGVFAIYGGGLYTISAEKALAEQQLTRDAATIAQYEKVQTAAKAYKANLAIAQKILSSGTSYSDFLIKTAQALPPGSVLNGLTLSKVGVVATTANPSANKLSLKALTTSYGGALQVKENLEKSDIFENVSLSEITETIVTAESPDMARKYPFSLTIDVTISKKATGL